MPDLYKKRFAELQDQLEAALASKKSVYNQSLGSAEIEISLTTLLEWKVKARSLIAQACGTKSEHFKEFEKNQDTGMYGTYLRTLEGLKAIFLAAREDYDGGYLRTTRSLIQAEVFDSELDQAKAKALHHAGYATAAAVIAGVILETSLRELCDRAGIAHAKLDKMNADLAKSGTYNSLIQKRITALAGIRNAAAHGETGAFTADDVEVMIKDVERFVADSL
jgi:hypothetical protein